MGVSKNLLQFLQSLQAAHESSYKISYSLLQFSYTAIFVAYVFHVGLFLPLDTQYSRVYNRPMKENLGVVRTDYKITKDQKDWLRKKAAAMGITVSELLRRYIHTEMEREDEWRTKMMSER